MYDVTNVVVRVDEQGNIINSMSGANIGLSVENSMEFDLIINKVPAQQAFEIRKYKVIMEGFRPKLVLRDGETPPVIPEPVLTLEQKLAKIEDELKKEKDLNKMFRNDSQESIYFLTDQLFQQQTMKEGM